MRSVTTRISSGSWARCGVCLSMFVLLGQPQAGSSQTATPATAPAQQVQLDVVLVHVKPGQTRNRLFPFIERAGKLVSYNQNVDKPFTGLLNTSHDGDDFLKLLRTLKQEGLVKVLAQPSLRTMSGTAGSFLSGNEQAIPVSAGLGSVGVQFEEIGVRLNYLPTVLNNGKIRLELEPEVSGSSAANGTKINDTVVPGHVTNRMHVGVELEAGRTIVIGGLIQYDAQVTMNKTPILSYLPIIGEAFNYREVKETENEVVIVITPTLFAPGKERP